MIPLILSILFTAALIFALAVLGVTVWRDRRAILAALFGAPRIEVRIEPYPLSADERATLRRALKRSTIVRKVLRRHG